jgi:hypothetical protein
VSGAAAGGGAARAASRCGISPAAELQGDVISVMSRYDEFYIKTFRALIMIVASFGRYLPFLATIMKQPNPRVPS